MERKFVKRLGFKYQDIEKAQDWFDEHEKSTVFLCRLVPVIRSLISIPAGMARMNFVVFSLWTIVGTLLWNTILVFVGQELGDNWAMISIYIKEYAVGIAIVVVVIVIIWFLLKRRNKNSAK